MTWIATYTGLRMDVFHPTPESIDIEDIAVALSRMPRFAGHTNKFYSVAQHSVLAYVMAPPHLRMAALMHDASEAYLIDLPRPIKEQMPEYQRLENRLMQVIADRFGFVWPLDPVIKEIDGRLLETEHRDLMPHSPTWSRSYGEPYPWQIKAWSPDHARGLFLHHCCDLGLELRKGYEIHE